MKEKRIKRESKIHKWTEVSWNPITGCSKISSGCLHCYSEAESYKQRDVYKREKYRNGFDLTLHEDVLNEPYHKKTPKRIFLCSMSDLFQEGVPLEFIQKAFKVMNDNPQHLYMVLTKRADILERLSPELPWTDRIMMGVTVEAERYKERIDALRNTGAKRKFISAEPLLTDLGAVNLTGIDWMFVGGESGPNSRPMEEEWVLNLRDQCNDQGTAFTFKQWGGVHKVRNGALLQGVNYGEMPKVMLQ